MGPKNDRSTGGGLDQGLGLGNDTVSATGLRQGPSPITSPLDEARSHSDPTKPNGKNLPTPGSGLDENQGNNGLGQTKKDRALGSNEETKPVPPSQEAKPNAPGDENGVGEKSGNGNSNSGQHGNNGNQGNGNHGNSNPAQNGNPNHGESGNPNSGQHGNNGNSGNGNNGNGNNGNSGNSHSTRAKNKLKNEAREHEKQGKQEHEDPSVRRKLKEAIEAKLQSNKKHAFGEKKSFKMNRQQTNPNGIQSSAFVGGSSQSGMATPKMSVRGSESEAPKRAVGERFTSKATMSNPFQTKESAQTTMRAIKQYENLLNRLSRRASDVLEKRSA